MNSFFLICPINTENLVAQELKLKWPLHFKNEEYKISAIHSGGIEISCPVPQGLLLNQILRTPNRILFRIKNQKCRDIPKLYNILKKIPWKNYLLQESVNFKVTAKKSRLIHTKKIEDAANCAISDYFQANKLKDAIKEKHLKDPKQTLFLRLLDDELTVSLDTSGRDLYKRGRNDFRGHAPIRENFAAILLLKLLGEKEQKRTLIDPMCGSATFLKEARDFFKLSTSHCPYLYLNPKLLENLPLIEDIQNFWQLNLLGHEIEQETINSIQSIEDIKISQNDLFSDSGLEKNDSFVIVNPPYGKKIKINEEKKQYFSKLVTQIQSKFKPRKIGIIIPLPFEKPFKGEKLYFKQNGIDVAFVIISDKK